MDGKTGPVVLTSVLSMLVCVDALLAKSVKTEILGSQTMSLSDCNAKIDTIASLLGVRPDLSVSPHLTLAYFWPKEGGDESVRVSCSGPDRKMAVALTSDHPRPVESYCRASDPEPWEEAAARCKKLDQALSDCIKSYGINLDDVMFEDRVRLISVFCDDPAEALGDCIWACQNASIWADPVEAQRDCYSAMWDSVPPPESAKTEVLGTQTMSYSDCHAKIETIASLLGVRPDYSVQSDLLTMGRFWLKEGRDESILVTCSEPDRKKMVTVLTFDHSIRRGPEAESYCQ